MVVAILPETLPELLQEILPELLPVWWLCGMGVMVGMHVAVRSPLADRVIQMLLWNISFNLSRVNRVCEVSLRSAAVGER